jgi:hypothetical protein
VELLEHGAKAGWSRNQRIIDEGRIGVLVAFSGGTGTADMIRRSEHHDIPVYKIEYQSKSLV